MVASNWLTIKELGLFHTLITTWKLTFWNIPRNPASKVSRDEATNCISTTQHRLQNTQQSYRWRSVNSWNSMPQELRSCQSLPRFKGMLRKRILSCRPKNENLSWTEDNSVNNSIHLDDPTQLFLRKDFTWMSPI